MEIRKPKHAEQVFMKAGLVGYSFRFIPFAHDKMERSRAIPKGPVYNNHILWGPYNSTRYLVFCGLQASYTLWTLRGCIQYAPSLDGRFKKKDSRASTTALLSSLL